MKDKRLAFLGLFTVVFFLLASALNGNLKKPPLVVLKQDSALNFSDTFLKISFAGYKRLMADILWITTLLESDLDHYKKKDLNNWLFLRFNSISKLDPLFLQNYTFGAQYLSIIKDDLTGASILFEKGLSHYPDNYSLIFNAAYLHAFETGDFKKASALYKKLRKFPQRPKFLESLIAKLDYQESGDLREAYSVLKEIYESQKGDSALKAKLKSDLYAIKATLDLECLNSDRIKCSYYDFNGDPYIKRGDIYSAQSQFTPYRLHLRNKKGSSQESSQ